MLNFLFRKVFLMFLAADAFASGFDTKQSHIIATVSFPTSDIPLRNLRVFQAYEGHVVMNTTTRLVRWRPDGIEPQLAESWNVSPDGKAITFRLRKDAFFADKTPITAEDVAWSIKRHFVNKGQNTEEFLKYFEEWERLESVDSDIKGIRVVDKNTLELHLLQPVPRIIPHFFGRLPSSVFKRGNVPADRDEIPWDFVSSGPYVIRSRAKGKVEFELNRHHWLAKELGIPRFALLKDREEKDPVTSLLSGMIDFDASGTPHTSLDVPDLKKHGIQFIAQEPRCRLLRPDFSGPMLRKYPSFAPLFYKFLDREKLVSFLPPSFRERPKSIYAWTASIGLLENAFKQNSNTAEKFLEKAKASFVDVFSGKQELTIGFGFDMVHMQETAEAIRDYLATIGIRVLLKPLKFADVSADIQNGAVDYFVSSYSISALNPAETLPYLVGLNPKRLNLPPDHRVYSLKKRIEILPDIKGQIEIVKEFNNWMADDGFLIPLFQENTSRLFSARYDTSNVPENTIYIFFSDFRERK